MHDLHLEPSFSECVSGRLQEPAYGRGEFHRERSAEVSSDEYKVVPRLRMDFVNQARVRYRPARFTSKKPTESPFPDCSPTSYPRAVRPWARRRSWGGSNGGPHVHADHSRTPCRNLQDLRCHGHLPNPSPGVLRPGAPPAKRDDPLSSPSSPARRSVSAARRATPGPDATAQDGR